MNPTSVVHPYLLGALSVMYTEQVAIQVGSETQGNHGAVSTAWTDVAGLDEIPAAVDNVVTERKGEPKTIVIGAYVADLKGYYPTITTKHRAVLWERDFDITSIGQAPFNAFTRLTLQEVA